MKIIGRELGERGVMQSDGIGGVNRNRYVSPNLSGVREDVRAKLAKAL